MDIPNSPSGERAVRHDGWTPTRRERFLAALAAGVTVTQACAGVGLSREAAYRARRRDTGFAHDWQAALQAAGDAKRAAFIALLPERLLRTMSELSGDCELRGGEMPPLDSVRMINRL